MYNVKGDFNCLSPADQAVEENHPIDITTVYRREEKDCYWLIIEPGVTCYDQL